MLAFFQSDGTSPRCSEQLNNAVIGPAMISASSFRIRDEIPSGPHDLLGFSDLSLFCTSSSVMIRFSMMDVALLDNSGISSVDSLVKTLRNCFCKIFALAPSSNLSESGSEGFSSKGAIPVLVLSFFQALLWIRFGFYRNSLLKRFLGFS